MSTKGGPAAGARVARKTGFDRPLTQEQYICWGGQLIALSLFYALGGVGFDAVPYTPVVIGVHAAIVALSLGLWLFLETHDPAEPSWWSRRLPDVDRWTKLSYDRIHMKKIEGLDHFCPWLNVSVGRSNYLPFILLVALGLCQFGLQVVVGLLWALSGHYTTIGVAIIVLHEVVVVLIWCMYVMLFGFHLYLASRGLSTTGYLMEMKKPKGAKPKAARNKAVMRHDGPSDGGSDGGAGGEGGAKGGAASKFSKLSASEVDEEFGLPPSAAEEEPSSPSAIELRANDRGGDGDGGKGEGAGGDDPELLESGALVVASTNDGTIEM